MRFADFDRNGDQKLDFEEFYALQTKQVRDQYTADEVRVWFEAADANGDGSISISEWFMWTLANLAEMHGEASLARIFAKYDQDGSGVIDAAEFEQLAVAPQLALREPRPLLQR